jgi:hypothetical protein
MDTSRMQSRNYKKGPARFEKNQPGEWSMKTSFRKLVLSLILVAFGVFASAMANARAYHVQTIDVFKDGQGITRGYVIVGDASNSSTFCNGSQSCIFFLATDENKKPGPEMYMTLSTAKQMKKEVAWFYGYGGSGPGGGSGQWGDFENADSGATITTIELWKDPATLPANVTEYAPFDIFARQGSIDIYRTCSGGLGCQYGGYAGYTGGWRQDQILTHDGWYNAYGYAIPIGTMSALYGAFSGQYGMTWYGAAPITGFHT